MRSITQAFPDDEYSQMSRLYAGHLAFCKQDGSKPRWASADDFISESRKRVQENDSYKDELHIFSTGFLIIGFMSMLVIFLIEAF